MRHRTIDLWGEPIVVSVSSESTNHASCTVVQTSPPGGGTMVHMHSREDEVLVPLEGDYMFFETDTWHRMHVGEPVYGVRGRPHAYRNVGASPGRMLVVAAPGGLDTYFETVSHLDPERDRKRLGEVSRMYGISIMPPDFAPPCEPRAR